VAVEQFAVEFFRAHPEVTFTVLRAGAGDDGGPGWPPRRIQLRARARVDPQRSTGCKYTCLNWSLAQDRRPSVSMARRIKARYE